MVVFGGGNEGIVDELHVYNTGKDKNIQDISLLNSIVCYEIQNKFKIISVD